MADEPNPGYYYRVLDAQGTPIGTFDELTGGEPELSLISYTQVLESGETLTRHIPGAVKYAPVLLLRPIDLNARVVYEKFDMARAGKLAAVRENFTVQMIGRTGGATLVQWDLINAVPVKISGFSFNEYKEAYYTTCEITVQAEEIIITFLGSEEDVAADTA